MFYDKNIAKFIRLKNMPLAEFIAASGLSEVDAKRIKDALENSVSGYIKITKDGTGEVNYGYTPGFGEGISCYMATVGRWYSTSVIQKINWEEKYFITLNSKYWFMFDPVEDVSPIIEEDKHE